MKKRKNFYKMMKDKYKKTNKKSIRVYLILRVLVIISMIFQILRGNIGGVFLCVLSLFLFTIPTLFSEKFNMELPGLLEAIVYMFIFSSFILGEINNFYGIFPFWDTMLHTLNGFLCAAIGFSLIDILNQNSDNINLSPIYVAFVAFCFSMTVGVCWEFIEFTCDNVLRLDMQKDTIIESISSVKLNKENDNSPVIIDNIEKTKIITKDKEIEINGYLDIGLIDTMKDLIVNFIGAITFSIIGFLYIKNRDKYNVVTKFIPKRQKN